MKLTIGMASFNNRFEVWATIQALRMYHDLTDTEIVVIDNYGCEALKSWIAGQPIVRYFRDTTVQGTAHPRNRIFDVAQGEWVMVIDPHVFIFPATVQRFREWCSAHSECMDLIHGPLIFDDFISGADSMRPEWGAHMWGVWNGSVPSLEADPYDITMHGLGLFACRKDAWLRFADGQSGFGGEEGVIHEKFRQSGRKVTLLPWLRWVHYFKCSGDRQQLDSPPYRLTLEDRVRNYCIGFQEIGLSLDPLRQVFGDDAVAKAVGGISPRPRFSVVYYSDLRNHQGVRDYCLEQLKQTVERAGGEVVIAINTDGQPCHARLYTQILDGLHRCQTDWVFFAEDDVLYPEEHFTQTPGISTFGFNKNVWHLSAEGFFPNDWPGVFLSTCFGHKEALVQAIGQKLAEAQTGNLIHAEPEGCERIWNTEIPILDIRHGSNFTGTRSSQTPSDTLQGWCDAGTLIAKMRI